MMKTSFTVFFLLSLHSLVHTASILTPLYPANSGTPSGEALDEGNIHKIEWGYNSCCCGQTSIAGFRWNNGTEILGTCSAGQCSEVVLAENEQINAYRIIYNPGVNQLFFRSNIGNQWHCGQPVGNTQYMDSGWITYQNYYLSGFKWSAGWILDRIILQFTMNPTQNPTNDPTTEPTIEPTNDPTNDPTIDPTNIPSRDPTTDPTKQTKSPTNTRSGSVETSAISKANDDNSRDLTINVNATNGIFNQYHVIRKVNASLNALLDTGYTLTADIIKPNVSINLFVDIYHDDDEEELNAEELTERIQQDLNKDSDIIYVVEVTQNDETVKVTEDPMPFGFDNFNELMIGICAFLLLIILISYIDAKWCRINDYFRVAALIIGVFQFVDMIYDCLFSIKITLDPNYSTQPSLFIILLLSITFIVIPTFITLIQLHFEMKQWKRNDVLSQWMFDNTALLYILSTICGSSFIAVRVCCSNLLNLSYFDMPLTQIQKASFYTKRIYSSNVPQIIIQIVYLLISKTKAQHNDIVYASMSFSILSIVISILTILSQQNIIKTRDFVTIEFDVKGDMILSKFNRCRNRYKILRKQLSLIFGIHSNIIEIRKPSLIPNGLRVHIIVHINNTKAIDINCEKLIKDAHQNGKLCKILKESWSLSATPTTENIKYEKHDSQDRKENTVFIKSMSEQINNNNTNTQNTMIAMVPIPQMSADDTEQPGTQQQGDEYMPPMIPPVMITPYDENNQNLPAIIPPIIATDYGESEGNKEGNNNMDDTDSSEDNNTKLIVATTDKEIVVDGGDDDVVQYVNNIDNVTVGASKQ